ncbi:MAG: peptidase domain-containing ABC transporter [Bacteroidia bacterium]|nr:peptidase domain-containing ABC transporter [Bacteroidia bacterium]
MSFPHYHQLGLKDCGPSCIKMIAQYFGRNYNIDYLREKSHIIKTGVSMLGISEAAEAIGFKSIGVKIDIEKLKEVAQSHPSILHWDNNHFVVLYDYKRKWFGENKFYIADPAKELLQLTEQELIEHWAITSKKRVDRVELGEQVAKQTTTSNPIGQSLGYALVLEPTPEFFSREQDDGEQKKLGINYLLHYFKPYKGYFVQLAMGMLLSSTITLASPMLTQAMIDKGVNMHNQSMVKLVLMAQLAVFAGSILIQFIQTKILMHLGTRINVGMVSDFFYKLFNLSIPFFDSHVTGDLMQRIGDHKRVESLLTVSSLGTVFSLLNMSILVVLLGGYHPGILLIFSIGAVLGFGWTYLFLACRKKVDYKMFHLGSKENSKVIEMLEGIQEIKINNSAKQHRWQWEEIQANLYKQKIVNLNVGQFQSIGGSILGQATSILISFTSATAVINGDLSLGGMFAINMIIGQLNSPIQQLYGLVNSLQQARIGMDRIGDVVLQKDETDTTVNLLNDIPKQEPIMLENVSFVYGSERLSPVLDEISFTIPAGKITAIVGASGSGKTTLLKLLMKFYEPKKGNIFLGSTHFKNLHHGHWRDTCGVVMQDGRLFNTTIAENIASGLEVDMSAIIKAGKIANIDDFISTLPNGYLTEIGNDGTQVSMGQRQRILLARAVYKNPSYLFLDEATSSLDANNERKIMDNLNAFFEGRTVVVIAHRLSTVQHADQIIVMENGKIMETGNHQSLTSQKGKYYELVKNQLELGN